VALTLVGSVVDGHDQPLGTLPGKNQEAIVCPVAVPRRRAFEELPLPIAEGRLAQRREKTVVELAHLLIDRLIRAAAEVRRDSLSPLRELPLVEKAQAGRQ